jgi:hypothetical protein
MLPLPPVEGGRGARGQAAGAGLHRIDPPRPRQGAHRQAERYRHRGNGQGGRHDRPGSGQVPHREPGQIRRGGQLPPGPGSGCGEGRPHGHHRQAPQRGAVQQAWRPAGDPGMGDRIGRHQRNRSRRHHECRPRRHGDEPGEQADGRQHGQQAQVAADHDGPATSAPGRSERGRSERGRSAPVGSARISTRAPSVPSAPRARATTGWAAGEQR